MKLLNLLAAAPLATAFVVPDQNVFAQIAIDKTDKKSSWSLDRIYGSVKDEVEHVGHRLTKEAKHAGDRLGAEVESAKRVFHSTLDAAFEAVPEFNPSLSEEAFDTQSWLSDRFDHVFHGKDDHRHHGPPHDGPPHDGPPHHGPPHHGPHRKHPHHKPNQTVYELIASSKYTTKLAKLINEYPDLVEALNGTKANYTVFAPTDKAFEKIPEHAPKPSKEFLKMILEYHISDQFYPAGRVLHTYTIPTLLDADELSSKPVPQRLAVKFTLRGLTLNYYARIVAIDIFGSNGVIHGLDSFVLPPPRTLKIIDLLPSSFSTFELALTKTGLLEEISKNPVKGGTLFLPDNWSFAKLGPGLNAFLFSEHGLKYLKAILQYHFVPFTTLYSDALYENQQEKTENFPRRTVHLDLPTLLVNHTLSVDVGRTGPFVGIFINGFSRATAQNGVARDGVIHVVNNVLLPPKTHPDGSAYEEKEDEREMCIGEFKARMAPYVQ